MDRAIRVISTVERVAPPVVREWGCKELTG
jgi:hypothetical protein